MIFFQLLLFIGIITAIVTSFSMRRQQITSTEETKQQISQEKPMPLPKASQTPQLGTWLKATDKIEPSLQAWLFTLSKEEFNTVSQELAIYCVSLDLKPDWLFQKPLQTNQQLQETMIEMIVAYLTSRQKAAQLQDQAQVFKTYQAFNENPQSHPDLVRKLFAKLIDDRLITISSSDLLEDDPKKRQEYMISTIRQTANDDSIGFNKALKAVVLIDWELNNLPF